MADRTVTHTARNTHGDIVAIGNPQSDWHQRRVEWAISDIVAHRHEYFVSGNSGPIRIGIVNDSDGPYLRTFPDSTGENNLDELPVLDLRPWEVAFDHAEILAVHAALVPHGTLGQVLLLGGNEHDPANADNPLGFFNTRVYDVATNQIIAVNSPNSDVFCCDHAFLPDGRLMVGGGSSGWNPPEHHENAHENAQDHWSGARECSIYNLDGTWTDAADLLPEPGYESRGGGRWYPTLLTLSNGEILAVAGHPRVSEDTDINDGRHGSWLPELYNPGLDAWTYQPGHWLYVQWSLVGPTDPQDVPEGQELVVLPDGQERGNTYSYLYYPRLFVVPGGDVFMASPDNEQCGFYDPATGIVRDIEIAAPPHGTQFRETNHTAVLLPLLPGNDYRPTVLFLGMDGAHRITLNPDNLDPPPVWQPTSVPRPLQISQPLRRHSTATILPTGDVLFSGGINHPAINGLPDEDAVLHGEIYHPGFDWSANEIDSSQEDWTTTRPASVPRNYHSVALLLPNGRVLTAGSNLDGQAGGNSVKEYRIEIFCPDYDTDTNRPVIFQAPDSLSYGDSFQINASPADRIERVALMRCGSATHAWDGDQRYVGLSFTNTNNGVIMATAPPDGSIAPPGPYMIWVIDDRNRPCVRAPFVILN